MQLRAMVIAGVVLAGVVPPGFAAVSATLAADSAAERGTVIIGSRAQGRHVRIIDGQPCRIVRESGLPPGLPSTPASAGPNGPSAMIPPQGSSSSVVVGSGAGGSGCVIVEQPRY